MRLAVSNIAWNHDLEGECLSVMKQHGIDAVEIALSKYWQKPTESTAKERLGLRNQFDIKGFEIVALQSLLFGTTGLNIFSNTKADMLQHLKNVVNVASDLGVKRLVFGSPGNRKKGDLSDKDAEAIAVPFFRELGDYADKLGTSICMEANSEAYHCDFIKTSNEAFDLVKKVDSPGFRLHLDTGNMILQNEDIPAQLEKLSQEAFHFHLSAERLMPISDSPMLPQYMEFVKKYPGVVSIEMLLPKDSDTECLKKLHEALNFCEILKAP